MADVLNAISAGGFPLMLFIMVVYLWRELRRSHTECQTRIDDMQRQQLENVKKISNLEGRVEVLMRPITEPNFSVPALRQPLIPRTQITLDPK